MCNSVKLSDATYPYVHHSAMHLPRCYYPYIFPTTPTTICTTPPYSTIHPILPLTYTTIHNQHHQPRHLISIQQPPLHPYPQSLHIHTTQNTTPHTTTNHSGVHCCLFHWFLGKCFLVEVHPYMTCFCTF